MLPTSNNVASRGPTSRGNMPFLTTYLRRIIKPQQMDFECVPPWTILKASLTNEYAETDASVLRRVLSNGICRYTAWLMLQLCIAPKTACVQQPRWSADIVCTAFLAVLFHVT